MIIHSWIYIIKIFEINKVWLLRLPQLVMCMASFLPFTHSSFLWLFEHTKLICYSGPLYLYRYTLYTSGSSCILLLHITQVLTQMSPLQGPFSVLTGTDGSFGSSVFYFLRNHQTIFQSICTILHAYQQGIRVLIFLFPPQATRSIICCFD